MSDVDKISLLIAGGALALSIVNSVLICLQHLRESSRYRQEQEDRERRLKEEQEEATKTVTTLPASMRISIQRKVVGRVSDMPKPENPAIRFYLNAKVTFYNESQTVKTVQIGAASIQYQSGAAEMVKRVGADSVKEFPIDPLKPSEPIEFMYVVDKYDPDMGYPKDFAERADIVKQLKIRYKVIGQGENILVIDNISMIQD